LAWLTGYVIYSLLTTDQYILDLQKVHHANGKIGLVRVGNSGKAICVTALPKPSMTLL